MPFAKRASSGSSAKLERNQSDGFGAMPLALIEHQRLFEALKLVELSDSIAQLIRDAFPYRFGHQNLASFGGCLHAGSGIHYGADSGQVAVRSAELTEA